MFSAHRTQSYPVWEKTEIDSTSYSECHLPSLLIQNESRIPSLGCSIQLCCYCCSFISCVWVFCLCVCLCSTCVPGVLRSLKSPPDALELELELTEASVWVLWTKPWSSGRETSALNGWATSPAPVLMARSACLPTLYIHLVCVNPWAPRWSAIR